MGTLTMDIQKEILSCIDAKGTLSSVDIAKLVNVPHQKVVGAIKSIESLGNIINVKQETQKSWECTEEGASVAEDGSFEARLFNSLSPEGSPVAEIKANFPNANIALGAAMKNKWVKKEGEKVVRALPSIEDVVQLHLKSIAAGDTDAVPDKIKADYKKRKLIKEVDLTFFEVSRGSGFTTTVTKQEAELTKEMIESGLWKSKTFKPFNFQSKGRLEQRSGHLHPLMQLRAEFRQIFLEMGFTEMPTNNFVESAFWNFDALFQPQQHPARDAHDTFYVAEPARTISVPEDYLQRVKKTHSVGGYGSTGYQYDWDRDEAHKNLLRTHTTAVSARMLYRLAQEGFQPSKFFSIDRVFRNETLDATHLAEFHQIEGVVADYNLGVKHLMGVIKAFFEKIGITKLRFKPAYNPYTEPSMEIFSYHEGLKKWVEVGNSGIFRPEMLRPMGLPEEVTIAAFGLSLERPAMIMYGIDNIRELVGPKVKMELILDNPVCTLNKFRRKEQTTSGGGVTVEALTKRQELILDRLSALQSKVAHIASKMGITLEESITSQSSQISGVPKPGELFDIVIYADPRRPPYSIRVLANVISSKLKTCMRVHCHSTVKEVSEKLQQFWGENSGVDRSDSDICLTLVWRQNGDSPATLLPSLSVSPLSATQICGEHNIGRYLSRLAESLSLSSNLYECLSSPVVIAEIDEHLDQCHAKLVLGTNKDRASYIKCLNTKLEKGPFIAGSNLSLADPVIISTLLQLRLVDSAPNNVRNWVKTCLNLPICQNLTL
ncbi:phenylalanine--tRNA ligase alpha subunit-like isoform X2 [Macrobrachium nipponense]|uniref:phenylalanine--tRNA ligase alpha subunit-like isoform X2 n=1 Tax=Macrobrachium nipponense TaxID=159736 RepID=UPI0030C7C14C